MCLFVSVAALILASSSDERQYFAPVSLPTSAQATRALVRVEGAHGALNGCQAAGPVGIRYLAGVCVCARARGAREGRARVHSTSAAS